MNDPHSPSAKSPIRVVKRDGTLEPFVISKMLNCIRNGLATSGETCGLDFSSAGGLAEAVFEYLESSYSGRPVPSRHVAELVELVLSETGHGAAGMAIREHAALREQGRKRLLVAAARSSDGRVVQHRWNKSLLVQHLRRQHHLEAPVARMIAGRVEQLVFNCRLRVVTSGLVREMARSELLAWGLLPGALVVKKRRTQRGGKVSDRSRRQES